MAQPRRAMLACPCPAAFPADIRVSVSWFALGLVLADAGLLLILLASGSERLWRYLRRPALLSIQVAGVLLVTWLIVGYAAQSSAASAAALIPGQSRLGPSDTALLAKPVGDLIWTSARLSLLAMAFALFFASAAGLVA